MYDLTITDAPDLYLVRIQADSKPLAVRTEDDRANAVTELPDLFGCGLRGEPEEANEDE
jgi:hypothetical protein